MEPCEVYDQVRCDECDKVFNSKNNLAQHVTKVHKFKDCVFDVCGKSFKKLSALESHKKTHQTVQCESCDKTFKLATFYMHRKVCQNVYKCTECDYTAVIFFILVLYKCMYSVGTRKIAPQLVLNQSDSSQCTE